MGTLLAGMMGGVPEVLGDSPAWRAGPTMPRIPETDRALARQLQSGGRRCEGAYANTLLALAPGVARWEAEPGHGFVYCLRNSATYEQVYYGRDGKLKRRYLKAVAHGTGFAYRWTGQDTLLVTNHHVATWPEVTDEDNTVSGVPMGARKVSESLAIVRNDEDDYEPGFIPLQTVVGDPALDAAVLKTRKRLNVMPYAIGSSSALKTGNAVEVRGYPLGAFAAANVGKVTNPFVEDSEGAWAHADFALDALVNKGNSGSPVLAVSCVTGEYELVGLFHAGYRGGEAMNLAVGADELRPLMEKLVARPRAPRQDTLPMTEDARRALAAVVASSDESLNQARFANRIVTYTVEDDQRLVFRIHGPDYPEESHVWVELKEPLAEDSDPPTVTVSNGVLAPYVVPPETLDAVAREHLQRVLASLFVRLARTQHYRDTVGAPPRSMAMHKRAEKLIRELDRSDKDQKELLEGLYGHLDRSRSNAARRRSDEPDDEPPAPPPPGGSPVVTPPPVALESALASPDAGPGSAGE